VVRDRSTVALAQTGSLAGDTAAVVVFRVVESKLTLSQFRDSKEARTLDEDRLEAQP